MAQHVACIATAALPSVGFARRSATQPTSSGSPCSRLASAPAAKLTACTYAGALGVPCTGQRKQLWRQQRTRVEVLCAASTETKEKPKTKIEAWANKRALLLQKNLRSVSPEEAVRLVKEQGYKILDVRPVDEYKEVHPEGSINVQLYRLIKEWTPWDILRRAGFAFFGVFNGTEENPTFLEEITSLAPKDQPLIVACAYGGTIKPSANLAQGRESRSLNAVHVLFTNGWTNVVHLEGGLQSYFKKELPVEFVDDE